jgi:flavin-dependent dehydrogenase
LRQGVVRRVADRVVLLGDAAGYVDAITGEGLTLAFEAAEALAPLLPQALAAGAAANTFEAYERTCERLFKRYARLASLLVWAARHPTLRRLVLNVLAVVPAVFGLALRRALPAPASPHKMPGL